MATIPKALASIQRQAIPTNTTQAAQSRGMGQMGQALGQASSALDALDRRAQRARSDIEDAEVRKLKSNFAREAAKLEIAFKQLQGNNAVAKSKDYEAALEKARNDLAAGLKDERLRGKFIAETEERKDSTLVFYAQHVAGEGRRIVDESDKQYEETAHEQVGLYWNNQVEFYKVVNAAYKEYDGREDRRGVDIPTKHKNVEESIQKLYVTRMEAAIKSKDPKAARVVFDEVKDRLGGAAVEAERQVKGMELPAEAAEMAEDIYATAGENPAAAREMVKGIPDDDPKKKLVEDHVNRRITERDDEYRRQWMGSGGWLQQLSSLRMKGAKLTDPRIAEIITTATDPSSPYADDARKWWQNEQERGRAAGDRAKAAQQAEADRRVLLAWHAMTSEERVDPKRDGSPAQRFYVENLAKASPDAVLKLLALQNENAKRREGGDVNYASASARVLKVAEGLGVEKGQAGTDFESWYATFPAGSPPTRKDLDGYLDRMKVKYVKTGFFKDTVTYGKPVEGAERAPFDQQTPEAQRAIERGRAEKAKTLAGTVVKDAQKKAGDVRNSEEHKAWVALVDKDKLNALAVNALRKAGYTREQVKVTLSDPEKAAAILAQLQP